MIQPSVDVRNIAGNAQVFEFVPLLSFSIPKGSGGASTRLNFQFTDRKPIVVNGISFGFLDCRIDNVSGSNAPFSPTRYTMVVGNTNTSANMTPRIETGGDAVIIPSFLNLLNANSGLRESVLSIYFYYPGNNMLERQSVFRVDKTRINTDSIVLSLIDTLEQLLPTCLFYV